MVWKSQESRPKKKVLKESQSAFLFCGYRIPTHFFFHPPWPEQKWCVQFPVCLQQKSLPRFEFPSFSPPKQRDGHLDLENFANLTTVRIQGSMWRPWWSWIIPMNHPIIVAFAPWVIGYLLKVFPESTAWIQGPLPRSFDSILLFGKKTGAAGRLDAGGEGLLQVPWIFLELIVDRIVFNSFKQQFVEICNFI